MQRCPPTNGSNHLHATALAHGTFDIDDLIASSHRQVDGLAGTPMQISHGMQRRIAHTQSCFDQIAQFQQA